MPLYAYPIMKQTNDKFLRKFLLESAASYWYILQVCVYIYIQNCMLRLLICFNNGFGMLCVQRIHIGIWDLALFNANFHGSFSFCLFQNAGPSPLPLYGLISYLRPENTLCSYQQSETKDAAQSALQEGLCEVQWFPPPEAALSYHFANELSFHQYAKYSAAVSYCWLLFFNF